ncbi:hypothetical protein Pcinc_015277 [Petrolisthes cinctipes]|uniref:Uncharacterized protein n=1 Tax=Petrolisthes cinctipes TaxID=88211 RepID=A0AAE1KQL7_PETCI|nr:hypothetical protein Pcinc_015277 [Petrolisthes cinctipes]
MQPHGTSKECAKTVKKPANGENIVRRKKMALYHMWVKYELAKENHIEASRGKCVKRRRPIEEPLYMYDNFRRPTTLASYVEPYSGRELKGNERRTLPVLTIHDEYIVLRGRLKQLHEEKEPKIHPDTPWHLTKLTDIVRWELENKKLSG